MRGFGVLVAVIFLFQATAYAEQPISLDKDWSLIGDGFTAQVDNATLLAEYPGSKGIMLVSPDRYGPNVSLRFEVLPLNPESVLVAMVGASQTDQSPRFPEGYDGGINHILSKVNCYFFAFHNSAHNRTPFVRQHPFSPGTSQELAITNDAVLSQRWHQIEITVQENGRLQMSVDGSLILSASSENVLESGSIILRVRGTKTHTASALFRNIVIISE